MGFGKFIVQTLFWEVMGEGIVLIEYCVSALLYFNPA
jgi:hypothetical protein